MNKKVKEKKVKKKKKGEEEVICEDRNCPFHGSLSVRGRRFRGTVKKVVGSRAVVEWTRFPYFPKYERYARAISRIHSHIPACLAEKVKSGVNVEARECRRLSKLVHSVIVKVF